MTTTDKNINDTILDATLHTLAKNKISGTRMHLIAAEAGTSQSNLHYHYPTKNDLLLATLDKIQKRFSVKRTASVDMLHKTPEQNLCALFDEKQDDILHYPDIDCVQFDYWVQGTVDPDIREKFRKSFDIWREDIRKVLETCAAGGAEPDMDALSHLMVSILMGASMQYLIDEKSFSLDSYFELARQMVLGVLRSAPSGQPE